jgi:hypothetical protein
MHEQVHAQLDSFGNQTGQLDGVVIDQRGPTLKLSGAGPALILAEGALAAIEVKSGLPGLKAPVVATYGKASRVRPAVRKRKTRIAGVQKLFDDEAVDDERIPFIVVAAHRPRSTWSKKCSNLPQMKRTVGGPSFDMTKAPWIASLSERIFASVSPSSALAHAATSVTSPASKQRGGVRVGYLRAIRSVSARRAISRSS